MSDYPADVPAVVFRDVGGKGYVHGRDFHMVLSKLVERDERIAVLEREKASYFDGYVACARAAGLDINDESAARQQLAELKVSEWIARRIEAETRKNATLVDMRERWNELVAERDAEKARADTCSKFDEGLFKELNDRLAKLEDTIKTWKDWHNEIADVLGLKFRERNATLRALRELVARGEGGS